jgi:hypothetical protein
VVTKSGFSQKGRLISFPDIQQLLENENQHMLVIIGRLLTGEVVELQCCFETHSDYCRTNSLLQTMVANTHGDPQSLRDETPFEGLDFDKQEWDFFLSQMPQRKYPRGDYLARLATTAETVFLVLSGQFEIRTNLDKSSTTEHNPLVGAGAIFGDLTFIQGGIATADIVAFSEDCEVVCFEKGIIDELTTTNPALVGKFYRFLAAQMVDRFLALQSSLLS